MLQSAIILNKKGSPYVKAPTNIVLSLSVILFISSFIIRGFEGVGYVVLAFTFLIIGVVTLAVASWGNAIKVFK